MVVFTRGVVVFWVCIKVVVFCTLEHRAKPSWLPKNIVATVLSRYCTSHSSRLKLTNIYKNTCLVARS